MSNWKNILIGTTVGAGIIGVVSYVSGLKRMNAELESVAKVSVHSVKLDGLTLRINVQIKNPTNGSLKIKFPFVKILSNAKVIGSSKVIDKDITIPKHGEANISAIMITMPAMSLLSLGSGILNMLMKKQSVPLSVQTISTIDLGWKKQPYTKTDNITLSPPKA